jgi:hypothetical protein
MTKDWKKIAQANGLTIPAADMDRITPPLDALEAAFRPLVRTIAPGTDLAVIFRADAEDGE